MSKISDKELLSKIIKKIYNIKYTSFEKSDREIIDYLKQHTRAEYNSKNHSDYHSEYLANFYKYPRNAAIADIGCGSGLISVELYKKIGAKTLDCYDPFTKSEIT